MHFGTFREANGRVGVDYDTGTLSKLNLIKQNPYKHITFNNTGQL